MLRVPFALQWTAQEKHLIPLKNSTTDGYIRSSFFPLTHGIQCYLQISPNGINDAHRGHTWAFFGLNIGNIKKVDVDFTVIIETANYSKKFYQSHDKSGGRGNFCCTTKEFFDPMNKYIVNGQFTIKVNGAVIFDDPTSPPGAGKQLTWEGGQLGDELWERDDTKDFTIFAGGNEIKVHKLIISTRSTVFTAMLNSTMKEAVENKVQITDFTFRVVEAAVKLLYDCKFVTSLSVDEQMALLQFLDKYNISVVKDKIESQIIHRISPSTVCALSNCSLLTNSPKLKEKCVNFLIACFSSKTPVSDLDHLDKDIGMEALKNSLYHVVETTLHQ